MPSVPAPDLGNGRHRPGPYPAASATLVRRRLPGHHPHAGLLGVAATAPARARPLRVPPGFANLKTRPLGTHHGVGAKHLPHYVDEFVFRFNRRRTPMAAFQSLLGPTIRHAPTTYQMLYLLSQPDRHYGDYPVGGGYSSSNWRPAPPSEGRIVPKRCLGMPNLCGATRWAKRYCTQISAAGPWAPEGPWPMGVRRASS